MYKEYNRVPADLPNRILDVLWDGFSKLEGYSPLHSIALLTDESATLLAEKWRTESPRPEHVDNVHVLGEFPRSALDGSLDLCNTGFEA